MRPSLGDSEPGQVLLTGAWAGKLVVALHPSAAGLVAAAAVVLGHLPEPAVDCWRR